MKLEIFRGFRRPSAWGIVILSLAALAGGAYAYVPPAITDVSPFLTFTANDPAGQSSMATATRWSDGLAPHSDADYLVQSSSQNWFADFASFTLRTPATTMTFPGDSLTLDNGCISLKLDHNNYVTIPQLVLYGCQILAGSGDVSPEHVNRIKGNATIYGTDDNPSTFTVSAKRRICVDSSLYGDENAVICVKRTPGVTTTGLGSVYIDGAGNATNYHGRWRVEGTGSDNSPIMLDFWGNTFGSYAGSIPGKPLIEAYNHAWLRFQGSILGNGVEIVSDGALTMQSYSGYSLSGRWSGEGFYLTDGSCVRSTGGGTLTFSTGNGGAVALGNCRIEGFDEILLNVSGRFSPSYNLPTLPIRTSAATVADNCLDLGPVILEGTGHVSPGVGNGSLGEFAMASLTCRERDGGIGFIRYSVATPTVTVMTTDVVRVTGDFTNDTGKPFPIAFEDLARQPTMGPGTVYPIFSAANLDDYDGEDFVLASADGNAFVTHQLEGAFEVRRIGGVPTLVLVQSSPAIVTLTGQDADGVSKDSFTNAGKWNYTAAPSAGYDYVVPADTILRCSSAGASTQRTFLGHSLAITSGGDLALKPLTAVVNDLRLYAGGIISIRGDGTTTLRGHTSVYSTKSNPAEVWGYQNRTFRLESPLQGGGYMRVRHYRTLASPTTPGFYCNVTADNSNYTGGWELYQPSVVVDFANPAAIGAPAAAFAADRIRFTSNAVWRCSSSFTLADSTCGITMGVGDASKNQDGGTFLINPDQTLELDVPVAGSTTLRKQGTGTLVLGYANPFTGKVRLQEGTLSVRAAGALARATLEAESDTELRVETPDGATFKNTAAFSDGRTVRVSSPVMDAQANAARASATLLRFTNTSEFDTDLVDFDKSRFHSGEVTLTTEPDGNDLLVRVHYLRTGTIIVIR